MFSLSFIAQLMILAALFGVAQPLAPPGAPLVGTKWRLKLDLGREPGTWMPPEWGASEGRLGVGVEIEFTDRLVIPFSSEGMVGPAHNTNVLAVRNGPSTFVSERGTQEVRFLDGGWCAEQRHEESGAEMLLRGWVDCASGCSKRDVSLQPGERIYFSTGVWPDEAGRAKLESQLGAAERDLAALEEEGGDSGGGGGGASTGLGGLFGQVLALRDQVKVLDQRNSQREYVKALRQRLPAERGGKGIVIAPVGSLVVKREKTFRTEYHIIGRCGIARVADEAPPPQPTVTPTPEATDIASPTFDGPADMES